MSTAAIPVVADMTMDAVDCQRCAKLCSAEMTRDFPVPADPPILKEMEKTRVVLKLNVVSETIFSANI